MDLMSKEEIVALLDTERMGSFGMASNDGRPYIIPMPFCFLNDSIYMRLAMTGRKGTLLAHNPYVCFEVDFCNNAMSEYSSVIIDGVFLLVDDLNEKVLVRKTMEEKYERLRGGFRPGHGKGEALLEVLSICKIVDCKISGRKRDASMNANILTAPD